MTRSNKIWLVVTIVLTGAIVAWALGQCVGVREAAAETRIGTALSGSQRVTELKPISDTFGMRKIERSTTESGPRTSARIVERSRTERTGYCIYHRLTNENLVCLYQEVYWAWRYNFDRHRASWIDVDWHKYHWRDNMLSNWWYFKSWDGTVLRSGEFPSAGENLQWRERQIWASFEYCVLGVGCTNTRQVTVDQHIENFGDGGYHS